MKWPLRPVKGFGIKLGLIWLLLLCPQIQSKIYDRCELAQELHERFKFSKRDLDKWLCLTYWESRYDTRAYHKGKYDGSGDHGIFQINDKYWCQPYSGFSENVCKIPCYLLRDDNLQDDIDCVNKMFRRHGFHAWVMFSHKCSGNTLEFFNGCDFRQRKGWEAQASHNHLDLLAPSKNHSHGGSYSLKQSSHYDEPVSATMYHSGDGTGGSTSSREVADMPSSSSSSSSLSSSSYSHVEESKPPSYDPPASGLHYAPSPQYAPTQNDRPAPPTYQNNQQIRQNLSPGGGEQYFGQGASVPFQQQLPPAIPVPPPASHSYLGGTSNGNNFHVPSSETTHEFFSSGPGNQLLSYESQPGPVFVSPPNSFSSFGPSPIGGFGGVSPLGVVPGGMDNRPGVFQRIQGAFRLKPLFPRYGLSPPHGLVHGPFRGSGPPFAGGAISPQQLPNNNRPVLVRTASKTKKKRPTTTTERPGIEIVLG